MNFIVFYTFLKYMFNLIPKLRQKQPITSLKIKDSIILILQLRMKDVYSIESNLLSPTDYVTYSFAYTFSNILLDDNFIISLC